MFNRIFLLAPFLLATTPDTAAGDAGNRAGREVYDTVCSTCHAAGLQGAPKSGDREAWIPRMKQGLDTLTLHAIRGHGGMAPRGGAAQLTDLEVRNAIAYMFDPGAEARAAARPPPAAPAPRNPYEATVDGVAIHFGLVNAERLRAYPPGSKEASMHGGVPKGSGYYHVNVTLHEGDKRAPLRGAAVEVEVVQAGQDTLKKVLEAEPGTGSANYGQYIRLAPRTPATFIVRIRPAGSPRTLETRFNPTPG
ncbi:c-type cytochrome [Usitatibacter palustris]|uniref:Cytochrome c domain-containing protein n=1 Tax=Usitatibacter palustris TaxID=2732487 RepID=A0A6M4H409_9PROT|nr:c-type cytochrome [Usitatibacter palustris]QJR14180.1 hypothetical protein DSM104440_00973 [Usitatibacter palustris]